MLFVFWRVHGLEKTLRQQHAASAARRARRARRGRGDTGGRARAGTADLVRAASSPSRSAGCPCASRAATSPPTTSSASCATRTTVAAQLTRDFRGYGIELALTEEALREVAERASAQGWARGLLTVLEERLRDFKFELPGRGVTRLEVDADTAAAAERLQARRGAPRRQ